MKLFKQFIELLVELTDISIAVCAAACLFIILYDPLIIEQLNFKLVVVVMLLGLYIKLYRR